MDILVTNNPLALERLKAHVQIEYLDSPLIDVLVKARNLVHLGHELMTHPLSGSVKPNETLYKSVLISGKRNGVDEQSVSIIGQCILKAQAFPARQFSQNFLHDMQVVDLSLILSAIGK